MIKKIFKITLLSLPLTIGGHFYFSNKEIALVATADQKNSVVSEPIQKKLKSTPAANESDELDGFYEKIEKDWAREIESFFIEKQGLSMREFADYKVLRGEYSIEKERAVENFHLQMRDQYGEEYRYTESDELEVFESQSHANFSERLRNILGEENFEYYLKLREDYNEGIRKKQDPTHGPVVLIYF